MCLSRVLLSKFQPDFVFSKNLQNFKFSCFFVYKVKYLNFCIQSYILSMFRGKFGKVPKWCSNILFWGEFSELIAIEYRKVQRPYRIGLNLAIHIYLHEAWFEWKFQQLMINKIVYSVLSCHQWNLKLFISLYLKLEYTRQIQLYL